VSFPDSSLLVSVSLIEQMKYSGGIMMFCTWIAKQYVASLIYLPERHFLQTISLSLGGKRSHLISFSMHEIGRLSDIFCEY
jgi:hypothetical protein